MIVLDCNAAFAIVRGTVDGEALSALTIKGEKAVAPRFFSVEFASAYAKHIHASLLNKSDFEAVFSAVCSLVDEFVDDDELIIEALNESARLHHSVYDMMYFVLARRNGATLLTLDQKLQRLCAENGVNCIMADKEFGKDFELA